MDEVAGPMITVEVCRVSAQGIGHTRLTLPSGATVRDALRRTGWLEAQGIDEKRLESDAAARKVDAPWAVAIVGHRVGLDELLRDHDRVELLAPVIIDPMLARQRRAEHRRKLAGERRWARDRDPRLPARPRRSDQDADAP
jgi:putative ubiquitin-RnfH superfamily antitoxin RatB of RatAB toxin-antitoxin module